MANGKNGNNQALNIAIVFGIVVLGVATLAALVIDDSGRVTSALGFLTGLVALLGGALKLGAIEKVAQMAAIQSAAAVSTTTETGARVANVAAKVDVVHEAVNGLNKAALLNQANVSDRAGFDRGVAEMTQVVAATSAATPPPAPVYAPADAEPPLLPHSIPDSPPIEPDAPSARPVPPVEPKPIERYGPPERREK